MITNLNYLKTAVELLEEGGQTEMTTLKILRVIAHICEANAQRIEDDLADRVDAKLERNYQDLQNQKLVDILGR